MGDPWIIGRNCDRAIEPAPASATLLKRRTILSDNNVLAIDFQSGLRGNFFGNYTRGTTDVGGKYQRRLSDFWPGRFAN